MVVVLIPVEGLKNFVSGIWGKPGKKPRVSAEVFFEVIAWY
jgi:hypothetical protein